MMPMLTVDMSMVQLFGSGFPDVLDGDIKTQSFVGKGMIGVNHYRIAFD